MHNKDIIHKYMHAEDLSPKGQTKLHRQTHTRPKNASHLNNLRGKLHA
jgi:hypothetical protein